MRYGARAPFTSSSAPGTCPQQQQSRKPGIWRRWLVSLGKEALEGRPLPSLYFLPFSFNTTGKVLSPALCCLPNRAPPGTDTRDSSTGVPGDPGCPCPMESPAWLGHGVGWISAGHGLRWVLSECSAAPWRCRENLVLVPALSSPEPQPSIPALSSPEPQPSVPALSSLELQPSAARPPWNYPRDKLAQRPTAPAASAGKQREI